MTLFDFLSHHFPLLTILYLVTVAAWFLRPLVTRRRELTIAPITLNMEHKLDAKAFVDLYEEVEIKMGEKGGGGGGGLRPPTLDDLEPGEVPPEENIDGRVLDERVNVVGPRGKA